MRRTQLSFGLATILTAACLLAGVSAQTAGKKFYSDDPLNREPETQDASGAKPWDIDLVWDLAYNLFANPGDPTPNVRAKNINTIDEVPDSSWFTNRIIAYKPLTVGDAVRGPVMGDGPAPGVWTIIRPKQAGFAPGFTIRDTNGDIWFVSFDAKGYPEAATGAILVAGRLFWALGYWQVENFRIQVRPENLVIADTATVTPQSGKRRPMRKSDLDGIFRRANRGTDGSYRAVAARGLPGKVLGGFQYFGTRPDDPNDLVPHEHRRELRALKVFGAWANLVDMKSGNTLDTVITGTGPGLVRHYLQDVGSTFGTGANAPREYDEGSEYVYERDALRKRLLTFGFALSPWQTAHYDKVEAIGRFEGDSFDPETWKPRVPTAAFRRARPDDTFWAARRVLAFTDDLIREVVKTGEYSDPAADKLLADVLIKRRDKIARAYMTKINPLDDFAMDSSGGLTFRNPTVEAGLAPAPAGGYTAEWFTFDNETGETRPLGSPSPSGQDRLQAPSELKSGDGIFVKAQVRAVGASDPSWAVPVDVYFKSLGRSWKLVGFERLP